ncbi:MAG: hypothetical protein A2201_12460 [Alicyclobacillus sp. RIFOXYA1_FULL_53_8]|nr:MAG: hypothetical protein A2201_12460 [Alicyclobacillus sp. RIFOXYA1_FULL_53_8]
MLADRVPRVPMMMVTDAVRLLLMGSAGVLVFEHHLGLWLINAFVIVYGAMESLFQPAYSAVRAEVFTPDIRNAANSLTQITTQLAQLLGPAIAGLLITLSSNAVGLWVDSSTFLISLLSLSFLRVKRVKGAATVTAAGAHSEHNASVTAAVAHSDLTVHTDAPGPAGLRQFIKELGAGYAELRQHSWLWMTILAFALVNIATIGSISILLPWLIKVKLGYPAAVYGFVTSGFGVGALVTALIFGHRSHWRRRGILAYVGVAVTGAGLLAMAFVTSIPLLLIAGATAGAGLTLFGLIWEGSLQELVHPDKYGRVSSLDMLGSWALLPLGFLATGWLAARVGGLPTLMLEGTVTCVIAIGMLFIPAIRRFQ